MFPSLKCVFYAAMRLSPPPFTACRQQDECVTAPRGSSDAYVFVKSIVKCAYCRNGGVFESTSEPHLDYEVIPRKKDPPLVDFDSAYRGGNKN